MIRPIAEQVLQDTWDKNTYITFYDERLCPNPDMLVHEYKDHAQLVRIDRHGKAVIIKQIIL